MQTDLIKAYFKGGGGGGGGGVDGVGVSPADDRQNNFKLIKNAPGKNVLSPR